MGDDKDIEKLPYHNAGWPQRRLRELLPDRIVALHPELAAGDPAAPPAGD